MLTLLSMEARGEIITYIDHEVSGTGTNTVVTEVERTVNTDDADVIYSTEMPNYLNQESGNVELYNKTVVLNSSHVFNNPVVCWGTVNIILCGDYTLNCWAMINVASGHPLNIYVKKGSTGTLVAKSGSNNAGIGSIENVPTGIINIHGGTIEATGGMYGAGIGGGHVIGFDVDATKGGLTIYDGTVTAAGGQYGAGIGGGSYANHSGNIIIYGGTITATAGENAAGVGGGSSAGGAIFAMYGGSLTATGSKGGAGIGGGEFKNGGTVEIYGGIVRANGSSYWLSGKQSGAGIGGGYGGSCGKVTIKGGTVYAKAGGQNGEGYRAIGPGESSNDYGELTIGEEMTVWAGTESSNNRKPEADRAGSCQYNPYAKISVCDHSGSAIIIDDGFAHHHDGCIYCAIASDAKQNHIFDDNNKCMCGLVSLKDHADNDATISTYNNTSQTITLTGRKLWKDGSWNTLCLPFAVSNITDTPLKDATVKTLESAEFSNGTLTLNFSDNLNAIEAGKPYIVKWAATTPNYVESPVFSNITISNATANVATNVVTFTGLYAPLSIGSTGDNTKLYLGTDNKLYYPNAAMTIGCQRAYFQLADGITAGNPTNSVRSFVLNFGDEDATGISPTSSSYLNGGECYDLSGRKVGSLKKGIYIHNGKIVILK